MASLTDADWAQWVNAMARLAKKLDEDGIRDLHVIVDMVEKLNERPLR